MATFPLLQLAALAVMICSHIGGMVGQLRNFSLNKHTR